MFHLHFYIGCTFLTLSDLVGLGTVLNNLALRRFDMSVDIVAIGAQDGGVQDLLEDTHDDLFG